MQPDNGRVGFGDAARRGVTNRVADVVRPSERITWGVPGPAEAGSDALGDAPAAGLSDDTATFVQGEPLAERVGFWSLRRVIITVLGLLVVLAGISAAFVATHKAANTAAGDFSSVQVPLGAVAKATQLKVTSSPSLEVRGQLRVTNSIVLVPAQPPTSSQAGQLYFDQNTKALAYYNGSQFVSLLGGNGSVQNTTNVQNLTVNGTTNAVTAVGGTANQLVKFTGTRSVGNSIISDDGQNVTIAGNLNLVNTAPSPPMTIWSSSTVPGTVDYLDNLSVEVGIKFQSDVDGVVTGLRFYKGPLNTGPHVGSLWAVNGVKLATVTFTNETATGWQDAKLSAPVSIVANTTYIVSYHTNVGQYAADTSYFLSGGFDNAPLHALQDGMDGGNGVFKYSATSTFPTNNGGGSNYWVDVDFTPGSNPFHYMLNGAQMSSTALSNNFDLAKRSSGQVFSGTNTFRNVNDSGSGFSIQSADSTALLTADTGAKIIIIKTLVVAGNATFDGHIIGNNPNLPPTIAAGPAACTTPTITFIGTDISGLITLTTGTGCSGLGKLATLTFALPYTAAPNVTLTPANASAAALGIYVDSAAVTINKFDIWAASGTLADATAYKWYYQVTQ